MKLELLYPTEQIQGIQKVVRPLCSFYILLCCSLMLKSFKLICSLIRLREQMYRENENLVQSTQDFPQDWVEVFPYKRTMTLSTQPRQCRSSVENVLEWPSQSPDLNPIGLWRWNENGHSPYPTWNSLRGSAYRKPPKPGVQGVWRHAQENSKSAPISTELWILM